MSPQSGAFGSRAPTSDRFALGPMSLKVRMIPPTSTRSRARTPRRNSTVIAVVLGAVFACLALPAADAQTTLSIDQLKQLSLEQLLNVNVTSVSRYPEKLLDVASAIQVISGEDIARSGASSLPEALRLAPNLDVAQKNPHDWGISARGFNAALGNKLLVMMDGRTLYTPLFSGVFWDVQDYLLEDIDRIEVVSGPGATLWGANAVNGVINITTKNARDTQGWYAEAGLGSALEDFAAVRYGTTLAPNVYLRIYGKTSERGAAEFANGSKASDSWRMRRGGFRLDADLPESSAATVEGDVYQGFENIVTGGVQQVGGADLIGRYSRSWSADEDMSLEVYCDRTHLVDPISNQFGTAKDLTDDLDTY
ncbi:MAG TPA: TonB-dependent receptor plug domain-containing protein, partial [Opitutaceae bacterium]|nr:TonB-dependent receptor plug domain-containing protein [Opitutaceae bacterium]